MSDDTGFLVTESELDEMVDRRARRLDAERREKAKPIIEALESELAEIRRELGATPREGSQPSQVS